MGFDSVGLMLLLQAQEGPWTSGGDAHSGLGLGSAYSLGTWGCQQQQRN